MGHAAVGSDHKAAEAVAGIEPRWRPFHWQRTLGRPSVIPGWRTTFPLAGNRDLALIAPGCLGGLGLLRGTDYLDCHRFTAQFGAEGLDLAEVVLAQPTAGKGRWCFQPQLALTETQSPGRPDPGLKGGFTEVGLQGLLDLVPQLIPLLHRLLTAMEANIRRSPGSVGL